MSSQPLPPTIDRLADVLDAAHEAALLADIERLAVEWERPLLREGLRPALREMACFGWRYVTKGRTLSRAASLPTALTVDLRHALAAAGLDERWLEQVIVSRYRPGAGIGWHTDAPVFGPVVATLSLATDWYLQLRRRAGEDAIRVELPRRSLLVLRDAARTHWQHRVPPVKALRYSISFRTLARSAQAS